MEKWKSTLVFMVTLLVASNFGALAKPYYKYWLNIDSGATSEFDDLDTDATWSTDQIYIQSGEKAKTTNERILSRYPLNTLLAFPTGTNNCYHLPLTVQGKFIVRAGFYYGNYDRQSKPPTFALEIDGNISLIVDTSISDDPIFHEVMFVTRKDHVNVCLVRTQKGHTPFISSLETAFVPDDVYEFMREDTVVYLERRTNYGANSSIGDRFSKYDEPYNRVWTAEEVSGYISRPGLDFTPSFTPSGENNPPLQVMVSGIEAQDLAKSIVLPINLHQRTPLSTYFVFYFLETKEWWNNETRKIVVYVDGQEKKETQVVYNLTVMSAYGVNVPGTANVTISPAKDTDRPAVINAMEVFTVIQRSAPIAEVDVEASKANYPLLYFNFLGVFNLILYVFLECI